MHLIILSVKLLQEMCSAVLHISINDLNFIISLLLLTLLLILLYYAMLCIILYH